MTIFLFIASVLIWGTTWLAITFQIGPIPMLVSVFYRFALAALVFLLGLAIFGKLRWPDRNQLKWITLQAACLFSLNFICFYNATLYITSGMVAVIFSLATLFNAANARIFFGDTITPKIVLASTMGVTGLAFLFGEDLFLHSNDSMLKGIALACLGTLLFSFGNMVSRRNSANNLSPTMANSWGMLFGAMFLFILIVVTNTKLIVPSDALYISALIYLAVIGSVAGFTTYLLLVARIGSAQAAYATVMFPIVALALSTVFEGFEWSPAKALGLLLALLGNVVMFAPNKADANTT